MSDQPSERVQQVARLATLMDALGAPVEDDLPSRLLESTLTDREMRWLAGALQSIVDTNADHPN